MSCLDQLERALDATDRPDPVLRALITRYDRGRLVDQARAADRAWQDGQWLGPLQGVTVVLKDNIDTAGVRTTAGAEFLRDRIPTADATVVSRLVRAGAILVGKANMTELAFGVHSRSAVGGQCCNPWDPTRIPGGSSGGSAVALATGMCALAEGSDHGGSLRNPASYCNVVGFRVSAGRIPAYPSPWVYDPFSVHGPMALSLIHISEPTRPY